MRKHRSLRRRRSRGFEAGVGGVASESLLSNEGDKQDRGRLTGMMSAVWSVAFIQVVEAMEGRRTGRGAT
jgi:hypothetical protein